MSKLELGKGLWSQIEQGNKRAYKVMTGANGMRSFDQAVRGIALRSTLDLLKEWKEVTEEEYKEISDMLNSDMDFVMGEMIIQHKANEGYDARDLGKGSNKSGKSSNERTKGKHQQDTLKYTV